MQKALRLIKKGPIEIAEVSGLAGEHESDFAARLRYLEELKSDGLISGDEYQKKRSEMLQEKWGLSSFATYSLTNRLK
jgi:hypothetical protein